MNIPEWHVEILQVVFKNKGVVIGGYLRDIIAGVEPTDIDIIIPQASFEEFSSTLEYIDYKRRKSDNADYLFIPSHSEHIAIEVVVIEDEIFPDEYLGLPTIPDVDVNLLAFDGIRLYNWMSLDQMPELWVPNIITRILKRQLILNVECSEERIQKMKDKGYTIIGTFDFFVEPNPDNNYGIVSYY